MLVWTFPGPYNVTFEAGLLTRPSCAPSRNDTVAMNAQVMNGLTAAGTVRGLHTVPVLILSEPRGKINKKSNACVVAFTKKNRDADDAPAIL